MMRRKMNTTFFIALLFLLAWLSLLIVEPFLDFVVGGLLLTFVFHPLYRRLLPYVRYPALASSIVIVVISLIIVFPVLFAVLSIVQDAANLTQDLSPADIQAFIATFDEAVVRWTGFEILPHNETAEPRGPAAGTTGEGTGGSAPPPDNNTTGNQTDPQNVTTPPPSTSEPGDPLNGTGFIIKEGLLKPGDVTNFLLTQFKVFSSSLIANSVTFIFQAFLGVFVMLFIMYYGFKDGEKFHNFVYSVLPLRDVYKGKLFEELREVVDAVFIGQIFVSLVQGTLGGLGFWAFGIPNPFFWGFVMTILAILPIIGTPVVWVPASVYMIVIGDTFAGVGMLIYGTVIVSTVDNFLKPKIIGDRAEIHPAVVLLGVVGGLTFFGFIGFLLGPLVLAIFSVLLRLFADDFVAREEINIPKMGQL